MGRWTPLILMAGGLAILLGTLLGINFPMDGRNTAENPAKRRESQVLPANINVNSTATGANGSDGGSSGQTGQESVAQNDSDSNSTTIRSATTTAQGSTTGTGSTAQSPSNSQRNTSGNNAPIRALW
ncbi:MAG: hypothetical protein WBA07_29175 [Rivularia sp. (in: cyanobacteria)]